MNTKKIFSVALATIGGVALTACSGGSGCCPKGNPVYQRPCCARSQAAPMYSQTTYTAPRTAPAQTAPAMPKPSGGQMACGAGKCG